MHSFSLPSTGFRSIKSWDDVKEPWDKAGRRYGPNWSVDDNLDPVETPGQTGAMVWPIPYNSSYVHPEMRADLPVGKFLRSRPNLGICMSGGGMRAAICALGWYRGLNHLNLLQKARYVSANSGATWTSLPLICRSILEKKELGTDIDLDEYLGKYEGKYDDISVEEKSLIGKNLAEANILDPEGEKTHEYRHYGVIHEPYMMYDTYMILTSSHHSFFSVDDTTPGFNAWSTCTYYILEFESMCLPSLIFIFTLTKMKMSNAISKHSY